MTWRFSLLLMILGVTACAIGTNNKVREDNCGVRGQLCKTTPGSLAPTFDCNRYEGTKCVEPFIETPSEAR